MSRVKIIVTTVTAASAAFAAWQVLTLYTSEVALMERYSHLDPESVIKAHRQMYFRALKGDTAIRNATSDADLDAIFLSIYARLP